MNVLYKNTLIVSAFLLCLGSLGCSVALFVMEQQEVWGMVLSGVFATALELCKFSFFPIGFFLLFDSSNYRKVSGGFVLVLGFVLLVVSVGASVGFFESATTSTDNTERKKGDQYIFHKNNIDDIDKQITKVNRVIDRYMDIDQQQRALSAMKKLDSLRIEKRSAIDMISTVTLEAKGSASSVFKVIANGVGGEGNDIRYWAYFSVATLIDICGVVALLLLSSDYFSPNDTKTKDGAGVTNVDTKKADKTNKKNEVLKEMDGVDVIDGYETENDFSPVVEKILSGAYGNRLSVRPITEDWKSIKLNSITLKEILIKMIDDGEVKKEGRFYYLRQSVIT